MSNTPSWVKHVRAPEVILRDRAMKRLKPRLIRSISLPKFDHKNPTAYRPYDVQPRQLLRKARDERREARRREALGLAR